MARSNASISSSPINNQPSTASAPVLGSPRSSTARPASMSNSQSTSAPNSQSPGTAASSRTPLGRPAPLPSSTDMANPSGSSSSSEPAGTSTSRDPPPPSTSAGASLSSRGASSASSLPSSASAPYPRPVTSLGSSTTSGTTSAPQRRSLGTSPPGTTNSASSGAISRRSTYTPVPNTFAASLAQPTTSTSPSAAYASYYSHIPSAIPSLPGASGSSAAGSSQATLASSSSWRGTFPGGGAAGSATSQSSTASPAQLPSSSSSHRSSLPQGFLPSAARHLSTPTPSTVSASGTIPSSLSSAGWHRGPISSTSSPAPQWNPGTGAWSHGGASSVWDSGLLSGQAAGLSMANGRPGVDVCEETSVVSFTWPVRSLMCLREEVEDSPLPSEGGRSVSTGAGTNEIWNRQPFTFGDGKWRLELVRTSGPSTVNTPMAAPSTPSASGSPPMSPTPSTTGAEQTSPPPLTTATHTTVLSVFLTSIVLDYAPADFELPAIIMVGIKPLREQPGRSKALDTSEDGCVWRTWDAWCFKRERELYECRQLPTLSSLLLHPVIAAHDGLALTVQVITGSNLPSIPPLPGSTSSLQAGTSHPPPSKAPFQLPGVSMVPPSLAKGIESLLDDANTGDVRILVRERGTLPQQLGSDGRAAVDKPSDVEQEWPTQEGGGDAAKQDASVLEPVTVVRPRFIWAHSGLLRQRSEYFATMLGSLAFDEGRAEPMCGRLVHKIDVGDFDYANVYWLCRWLYTDRITFADYEDVRSTMLDDSWTSSAAASETRADARGDPQSWDWKVVGQEEEEGHQQRHKQHSLEASYDPRLSTSTSSLSLSERQRSSHPRDASTSSDAASAHQQSSHSPTAATAPPYPRHPPYGVGYHEHLQHSSQQHQHPYQHQHQHPTPPQQAQQQDRPTSSPTSPPDPHPHPAPLPRPASALSIYRLAHRYELPDLAGLALAHLVENLTPSTAFPLMLSTWLWEELHTAVKGYVYDNWPAVAATAEFERCCDEVSCGEWGIEAGRVLRTFMKSLVSPVSRTAAGAGAGVGGPGFAKN